MLTILQLRQDIMKIFFLIIDLMKDVSMVIPFIKFANLKENAPYIFLILTFNVTYLLDQL